MKTPEELRRELANNPAELVKYAWQLQEQVGLSREQAAQAQRDLTQAQHDLRDKAHDLAQTKQELEQKAQQLAEAQAIIAELKRELFGAKADKLTPEQEEQLKELIDDAQEQSQRSPPLSQEVLQEAITKERSDQRQRTKERRRRHLPPGPIGKTASDPRTRGQVLSHHRARENTNRSGRDQRV